MTLPQSLITTLVPLPVLVPLLAAAITLVLARRPRVQRAVTLLALTVVLVVSGLLLYLTDRDGTTALQVGGWDAPVGITLVADRLAGLMLVVSSIVLLAVIVYAVGQGVRDGTEHQPVSIFLPTYLVLTAGVCNAFLGIPTYLHGARSMQAIVEMSSLAGSSRYTRSNLPAAHQLSLHVDPEQFGALLGE